MALFGLGQIFKYLRAARIPLGMGKSSVQSDAILLTDKIVGVAFQILFGWFHF